MLEKLTANIFEDLTEQVFQLRHENLPDIEARLIEVRQLSDQTGPAGRTPFSLLFACPGDTEPVQSTFRLEHEKTGELEVFLVPVGKEDQGLLYEAVFT
ncbi:MAG: hypothetical protein WD397_11865 [Wenzhouxiangellaceae bacterium]